MKKYNLKIKLREDFELMVGSDENCTIEKELDFYRDIFLNCQPKPLSDTQNQVEPQNRIREFSLNPESKEDANCCENLSEFLENKALTGPFDEFIAVAYYIKNLLKENEFTLKFLNSKLYPVNGNIIGKDIVDEAKERGYLEIHEYDDGNKYSLNFAGEEFFSSQLSQI